MNPPFEGLLGDTAETRLLQFLLPMYGIEFGMAELVEEIGLTRQSIAKAISKFAARGMVRIRKEGRTPLYSINAESPLVKRLEDFDNSLIESMVGPEVFRQGRKKPAGIVPGSGSESRPQELKKVKISFDRAGTKISGIASRDAPYRVRKNPVKKKIVSR